MAIRTRRLAPPLAAQPASVPLGVLGTVRRPLSPVGSIYAVGEEWSARAADDSPAAIAARPSGSSAATG